MLEVLFWSGGILFWTYAEAHYVKMLVIEQTWFWSREIAFIQNPLAFMQSSATTSTTEIVMNDFVVISLQMEVNYYVISISFYENKRLAVSKAGICCLRDLSVTEVMHSTLYWNITIPGEPTSFTGQCHLQCIPDVMVILKKSHWSSTLMPCMHQGIWMLKHDPFLCLRGQFLCLIPHSNWNLIPHHHCSKSRSEN